MAADQSDQQRRADGQTLDALCRAFGVQPGDVIVVGDSFGWVNKIGVRAVSIITRDGKEHLIPNENLMTQEVENWSYSSRDVRVHIPVGVAYDCDLPLAQKLIGEAFKLKRVDLGDVILNDLVIMFSDAPIFTSLNLENRPAVLLGMNAMRAFDRISIDFARKQLRMVVPEASSLDWAVMAQRRRTLGEWSAQQ